MIEDIIYILGIKLGTPFENVQRSSVLQAISLMVKLVEKLLYCTSFSLPLSVCMQECMYVYVFGLHGRNRLGIVCFHCVFSILPLCVAVPM